MINKQIERDIKSRIRTTNIYKPWRIDQINLNGSSNTTTKYLQAIKLRNSLLYSEYSINSTQINAKKSDALFQMRAHFPIGIKSITHKQAKVLLLSRLKNIIMCRIIDQGVISDNTGLNESKLSTLQTKNNSYTINKSLSWNLNTINRPNISHKNTTLKRLKRLKGQNFKLTTFSLRKPIYKKETELTYSTGSPNLQSYTYHFTNSFLRTLKIVPNSTVINHVVGATNFLVYKKVYNRLAKEVRLGFNLQIKLKRPTKELKGWAMAISHNNNLGLKLKLGNKQHSSKQHNSTELFQFIPVSNSLWFMTINNMSVNT